MSTSNKFKLLILSIIVLLFCYTISQAQLSVANVPITVKLQAGNVLIAQCITNAAGEFTFDFSQGGPHPASGTFIFLIKILPGGSVGTQGQSNQSPGKKSYTQTLTANFKANTPRPFLYILKWVQTKANKGSFAVSGRNSS